MPAQQKASPEITDCIAQLRVVLEKRLELLNALIATIVKHPSVNHLTPPAQAVPEPIARVLPLMAQALGSSCHTLLRLTNEPGLQTRDCYSIVRSIVELGVNICYVIGSPPDIAERAIRHSQQKAFRDLERESVIGQSTIRLAFSHRPDPALIDGLEADLAEFTSRGGREKGWVDESIDDRIAAVGRNLGESVLSELHFARFMVYRHSSEILHGTLFGVHHFFGLTVPGSANRTLVDAIEGFAEQQMTLLMAAGLVLSAAVEAFDTQYGCKELQEASKAIWTATGEIQYFQRKKE